MSAKVVPWLAKERWCSEFAEGRLAYLNGQRSDTNPYRKQTEAYDLWRSGWLEESLTEAFALDAETNKKKGRGK